MSGTRGDRHVVLPTGCLLVGGGAAVTFLPSLLSGLRGGYPSGAYLPAVAWALPGSVAAVLLLALAARALSAGRRPGRDRVMVVLGLALTAGLLVVWLVNPALGDPIP